MKYEDVVVEENIGKVYLCLLCNGQEERLVIHDSCEKEDKVDPVLYEFDTLNAYYHRSETITEVIEEVLIQRCDEDDEQIENNPIDWEALKKFEIQANVFQYKSATELDEILKLLDNPIIDSAGWCDNAEDKYLKSLPKDYGVVFYWSEYDDFSCYGDGFTHHCKIICGVKEI